MSSHFQKEIFLQKLFQTLSLSYQPKPQGSFSHIEDTQLTYCKCFSIIFAVHFFIVALSLFVFFSFIFGTIYIRCTPIFNITAPQPDMCFPILSTFIISAMYIGYFYIYIRSIGECYAKLKYNDEENLLFDSENNIRLEQI